MFGLSTLGIIHTLISLVAVFSALVAFWHDKAIIPDKTTGKLYIYTTYLTAFTGFGIFAHGGFGKAHVLGIVTIIVLTIAIAAGKNRLFGRLSAYVATGCFSTTFFFHMIPAITEATTRLPLGHPLLTSPEDPALKMATGFLFFALVAGVYLQFKVIRYLSNSVIK